MLRVHLDAVSALAARSILAEIERDMSRFPTVGHLLSWCGLCPRNNESAGTNPSSRLRKGDLWLKVKRSKNSPV